MKDDDMFKVTSSRIRVIAAALLGLAGAASADAQARQDSLAEGAGAGSFDPVARVLMHPRCLNCHQSERPRQTDAGLVHAQGVRRGRDGHGAVGLPCSSCHQGSNAADGKVPGAAHWQLAPASMDWQGLAPSQLCRQLKDPERNGNRHTGAALVEHVASEPLVVWAWAPGGGRSQPPLAHAEFVAAVREWVRKGMPCPS